MISPTGLKDVAQQLKGYFVALVPELTTGILTVVVLACSLFAVKTCFGLTNFIFSLDANVFLNGHVHKLFTYPFYHRTLPQLTLSIAALVFLCCSFEKSVGTIRFIFLFVLLSTCIGLWYVLLCLFQDDDILSNVEGLIPITIALVAVTTMHTRMTKGFLLGVSIPTMALPWVFLVIATILVPHAVLPCNIIAVLTGWMHGKRWFSFLDMSEAKASVLEKKFPFRLLRSIPGVIYVPASQEERRKTLLPQINPTPGSYPVQAYAPASSIQRDAFPKMYEGWSHSTYELSSPASPIASHGHGTAQSIGHSCSHSHGHSHGSVPQ